MRERRIRLTAPPNRKQLRYMLEASLVTFDVFDTSLVRSVPHPTDVFRLVAWRFNQRYGRDVDLDAFRQARILAETTARLAARAAGQVEVHLAEIYAALDAGIEASWRGELLEEELATERDVSFANPAILELYERLIERGVPVAFVSDTYFTRGFVEELLRSGGYSHAHRVFVSSEAGHSKHAGGLFAVVANEMHVRPNAIVHVGDNLHSDVEMARRAGIRPLWRMAAAPPSVGSAAASDPEAMLAQRVLAGSAASLELGAAGSTGSAPWGSVGRNVGAPLYLAFTQWIAEDVRTFAPDVMLFCARDGLIVKSVYDRLKAHDGELPRAEYFIVSRRSLVFPSFVEIGPPELEFLCSSPADIRVHEYLDRIGLDSERERTTIEAAGLRPDSLIASPAERTRLRELMVALTDRILARAADERRILTMYLAELGYQTWNKIAICDVGWHGSLQQALRRVALPARPQLEIRGYYVGTSPRVRDVRSESNVLAGWLWDAGQPRRRMDVQENGREVMELLFTARHPSVIGRSFDGTTTRPIFDDENKIDLANREAADAIQQAALACIDRYLRAFGGVTPAQVNAEDAYRRLARLIERPTRAEVRSIGALTHVAGFGATQTGQPLARAPGLVDALRDPRRFRKMYRECRWPTGFLASFFGNWRVAFGIRAVRKFARRRSGE